MKMVLFGVFGRHTTEACPINNQKNRKYLLAEGPKYPEYAAKNNVKILG